MIGRLNSKNSERRRRLAKEAKRRGVAHGKSYLKLQNWTLLVTNFDEGAASSGQLLDLYETRWRIENVFKLAKSETKLRKLVGHRSNPHHIDLLLWGWILAMVEFGKMGFFATIESRPIPGPCYQLSYTSPSLWLKCWSLVMSFNPCWIAKAAIQMSL